MRYKKLLTILIFLSGYLHIAIAQSDFEDDYEAKIDTAKYYEEEDLYFSWQREVGLDFTPLISKLIPFNLADSERQLVGLRYKRYRRTHAFRVSLGAGINSTNGGSDNFFFFSMGYEKRKIVAPKWNYTTGIEFVLFFDENASFRGEGFTGLSKLYGFEYNISDQIFLATEASLSVLFGDGETKINLNIPQSVFLFVRF